MSTSQDEPRPRGLIELEKAGVPHRLHRFEYRDKGGTAHSSASLGWPEHSVIKSLVFLLPEGSPVLVLMNGDRKVDTKKLARVLNRGSLRPAPVDEVFALTGYLVGGVSPFGLPPTIKVYINRSVIALTRLLINAGARGQLVEMAAADLVSHLRAEVVEVDRDKASV